MSRRAALGIVAAAAVVGALRVASATNVPGDFLRYHRAGRLVVTGLAERLYDERHTDSQQVYAAERVAGADPLVEREFKYSPATAVAMAPLGALPPRPASVVWAAGNAALIAWMLVVAWRWCARGVSAWWALAPLVLLARPIWDNLVLGQVNPLAIVPATVGLVALHRGRDVAAGALVGAGAVAKYLPGLLAVHLAWKRRWKALAVCVAAAAGLGLGLPAAVLGPQRAWALTREWVEVRGRHYGVSATQDLPGYSLKSLVYRTLGDTPYVTGGGPTRVVHDGSIASLPPTALWWITIAAGVVLLAAVLASSWGPLRGGDDPRGPPEAGAMLALLLLVSPEARFPHFLYLALPLVALTCALVSAPVRDARWRAALVLCLVGALLVNATAEGLVGEKVALPARVYCAPGLGALALLAALLVLRPQRLTARQPVVRAP